MVVKIFTGDNGMKCVKGLGFLWVAVLAAFFALSACDDSSSASSDETGVSSSSVESPDSSVTLSPSTSSGQAPESAESNGSSNETKDKSSSNENKSSSSAKESKNSSDSKSSSSVKVSALSSSSVALATPCKTETEDSCEYGTLNDERDGQIYKTVKIGDQWWMAENLNYEAASGSYCYGETKSDPKTENCATYGRLYIWSTAVGMSEDECVYGSYCSLLRGNVQGICPDGWHIPTNDEWGVLIIAVGGSNSSTTGVKLKATTLWKAKDGITNVDAVGFAALPAGDRGVGGGFYGVGSLAYFWSASQYKVDYPNFMTLRYDWRTASLSYCQKGEGFSVRCVKDSD